MTMEGEDLDASFPSDTVLEGDELGSWNEFDIVNSSHHNNHNKFLPSY